MLTLLTLAIMVAGAVVYAREGLFKAIATLFGVFVAGVVAFGFAEPLAGELESTFADFAPGYEDAVCMGVIFAVVVGLIRAGAYSVMPDEPSMSVRLGQAGGALVGLATGFLVAGFLVNMMVTLPWHEQFLGFQPRTDGASLDKLQKTREGINAARQSLADAAAAEKEADKLREAKKDDEAGRKDDEAKKKRAEAEKIAVDVFKAAGQGDKNASLEARLTAAAAGVREPDSTPVTRMLPPDQLWIKMMHALATGGMANWYSETEVSRADEKTAQAKREWEAAKRKDESPTFRPRDIRTADILRFEARYTQNRRWTDSRDPAASGQPPAPPGTKPAGPTPAPPPPAGGGGDDTTIKRGF